MNEILKHMKKITKIEPSDPKPDMFDLDTIEGDTGVPTDGGQFRVKVTHLQNTGTLHIQLGHCEPQIISTRMEEDFGTPFSQTGSERVLRQYGVAFNIPTAHGSIDQHEMMELGHRLNEQAQVKSYASPAGDYTVMEFTGVVDGKDNNGDEVKMMEFKIGEKEKLFVAYSHLEVVGKHKNENYPTIKPECLLAWLQANFTDVE